jgi:hypothetical protein
MTLNAAPNSRAAYMREWRSKNKDSYEANKKADYARDKALLRLARMYPQDLESLVNEERTKAGLPPVGRVGSGRRHLLLDYVRVEQSESFV